jgi:hypothetical protein
MQSIRPIFIIAAVPDIYCSRVMTVATIPIRNKNPNIPAKPIAVSIKSLLGSSITCSSGWLDSLMVILLQKFISYLFSIPNLNSFVKQSTTGELNMYNKKSILLQNVHFLLVMKTAWSVVYYPLNE